VLHCAPNGSGGVKVDRARRHEGQPGKTLRGADPRHRGGRLRTRRRRSRRRRSSPRRTPRRAPAFPRRGGRVPSTRTSARARALGASQRKPGTRGSEQGGSETHRSGARYRPAQARSIGRASARALLVRVFTRGRCFGLGDGQPVRPGRRWWVIIRLFRTIAPGSSCLSSGGRCGTIGSMNGLLVN
jgi:hypothetical protein